ARKGYQPAWRKVADLYLQGKGVGQSVKKAKYWLKKLSNSGDIQAIKDLKDL
ncbi:MAG: SEL1-like repeat protein, partial [Candidatus Thioglobus sp.]|nr:SEL1-like repeat protein [Candidatus Thioglobus sp.]